MKRKLEDLAVFGGKPEFSEPLHVGRPTVMDVDSIMDGIRGILESKRLTNDGPQVQELESRIAQFTGVKHCISVSNGTTALQLLMQAAGIQGEVILPSFTFVATAHALLWQGLHPVFCDINLSTQNIDPEKIEELITPRTSAILGVHLWGRPCEIDRLQEIATKHNLKIFFDAAHASGCSYKGRKIGNFGNAEIFSFHATKIINALEGGAVLTNDAELAGKVRLMKNFGFNDYDSVVSIGINGKMNEVSAWMGICSLNHFEEFKAANMRNYREYRALLQKISGLHLVQFDEDEDCNYHHVVIEVDETVTRISRDRIVAILWAENILARRYFYPGCHRMQPYSSQHTRDLPNTDLVAKRVISLPTGIEVEPKQIHRIGSLLGFIIENSSQILARNN